MRGQSSSENGTSEDAIISMTNESNSKKDELADPIMEAVEDGKKSLRMKSNSNKKSEIKEVIEEVVEAVKSKKTNTSSKLSEKKKSTS